MCFELVNCNTSGCNKTLEAQPVTRVCGYCQSALVYTWVWILSECSSLHMGVDTLRVL